MDRRDVVVVLVKVSGFILFLQALTQLPDRLGAFATNPDRSTALFLYYVVIPSALNMALGLGLWTFPIATARGVLKESFDVTADWVSVIQPVIFGGIGLWLILDAARELMYIAVVTAWSTEMYVGSPSEDIGQRASVVVNVVCVIVGIALLFGARGISELVRKARYR